MNRSFVRAYLKQQGFSSQKINKIENEIKSVQDFILLVPKYGSTLKPLLFYAFGFQNRYSEKAYDENVWLLLREELDIVAIDKMALLLKQPNNKQNRIDALISYYVNDCNQGVCETWKVKNFLSKYNEVLECSDVIYTSKELNKALNEIKYFL